MSGDRSICSYVVSADDLVLVTNSLVQVAAFADVRAGRRDSLAGSDEYRFFRDRYAIEEPETAFRC